MRMKKVRAAAAALLCAACLAQTAVPALAAEAYTAPDVTGKTLEQLMDDFRAEHALTGDNFEISFYVPETGEQYDFNETKMLYGASTYKLPLNLYYYDMQLAGEITGDTMITQGASLDEAHYQSLVYSNNELSYSLWRRIGDWPEYKMAMRKYFTMTDDEIPQNYYYDHLFCTRMMLDTLKVVWDGQEQYPELIDYLKIACPDAYFKTYLDVDETPIAHKYGSYEGAENDVGIIWAERPFLLAVYTSGLSYGPGGNVDAAYADGQSAGSVICGQLAVLLKTYLDEQVRLEREQAEKEAEEARLAKEQAKAEQAEKERLAAEAKAAEEKKAEEERQAELQRQAEEQAAQEAAQKAAEEAAREAARQAAHRRLVIRLTCVGAFSALVIALAVVLIRKLHKAGRCGFASRDDPAGLLIALLLGEDAAAVFLHIKAQLPRTGLAVAEHGAEILIIKFHAVFLRRAVGHVAHQLVLLIGADEQRRRKRVEPALLRGPCRLKKAHFVAFDAPARDIAGYLAHKWPQAVIVAHEKGQLDGLRVFLQAVPPGAVFGKGMNVGVIPVSGQIDPIRAQRVDRHIRAGRAADVHQQFHDVRLLFVH